jgi:hypothetical protein
MNNYDRISGIIETLRTRKGSQDVYPYLVGMMTAVLTDAQLSAMEETAQEYI